MKFFPAYVGIIGNFLFIPLHEDLETRFSGVTQRFASA